LNYIATGDNLHSGENFMQGYANKAVYSLWPPLYPILISFLMNFGLTPEASAALIPVISFALLVFPVFYLGKKIGNRILAYTGCISCVVFQPLIFVSSYAWTEMPFILLSSMSLLCMTEYYSSKNETWASYSLFFSALFASLSVLMRYIGFSLIIAELCVIIIKNRNKIYTLLSETLLFFICAAFPILFWFYRNLKLTGFLVGQNEGLPNFQFFHHFFSLMSILKKDFIDPLFFIFAPKGIVLVRLSAGILCIIIFVDKKTNFIKFFSHSISFKNYTPVFTFVVVYLFSLVVLKTLWEQIDPISSRLLVPVYPHIIVLGIGAFFYVACFISHERFAKAYLYCATVFVAILIFLFLSVSIAYIETIKDGQGYNDLNFKNNDPLVRWVEKNVENTEIIYVNQMIFWYIDYKLRIPERFASPEDFLSPETSEEKLNAILDRHGRINIIMIKDFYSINKQEPLVKVKMSALSEKYNYSFECLDIPYSTGEYSIIRIGKNTIKTD
jgi:4-amino-4-deoxy-L-arabinose transferase-like glycosyltransferase